MANNSITVPATSFYWQVATDGKDHYATERCSQPLSLATTNPQSSRNTTFPIYLTLFAVGRQPSTQLVLEEQLGFFSWNANLPVNTNFSIALTDSSVPPTSGGVVDGFYITDGGLNNCTDAASSSTPLEVLFSPQDKPCDEIDLSVSGGTAPYTAMLLSSMGGSGNLSDLPSDTATLRNTIPAGQTFHLAFADKNGLTSVVSDSMTSALNSPSCHKPTTPHRKPISTAVIIGATIAAVAAAIILALLAWWCFRRRAAKALERSRQREEAIKGEYRMDDGTAPLVEPFVIPRDPPPYASDLTRSTSFASTTLDFNAELADPNEFGFRTPTGDVPLTPVESYRPQL
ncbi:hypothetical protein BCR35DRAFT_310691 [Leucosporidium creatinivorum]|uniref:Uncharacterized protein n=1 Tax=Leucosporidium creatinivorum TaxID=106004 RepID=A0A1Y2CXL7_9BASI|nr:hypothetical protein BCR35DRAFT_310691 [Leucosporidium creatinivorum]